MGDVIEFPTQDVKLEQLKTEIEKGVTDLEFKYTELDTRYTICFICVSRRLGS